VFVHTEEMKKLVAVEKNMKVRKKSEKFNSATEAEMKGRQQLMAAAAASSDTSQVTTFIVYIVMSPVWCHVAECRKRRLNQGSFITVFVLFVFSGLSLVL